MGRWERFRQIANWVNLSTPSGLLLARAVGCRVRGGPHGLYFALRYEPRLPIAGAFTVGNVVFFRPSFPNPYEHLALVDHESTHSTQYALCLGLPFIPLYFLAAGYSWLRTADPASENIFERTAGLSAGGYTRRQPRPLLPVLSAGLSRIKQSIVTLTSTQENTR